MNIKVAYAAALSLVLVTSSLAGDKDVIEVPKTEGPTTPFSTFIKDSKPFVNGRLRYEWADVGDFEDGYVLSLRNYFGIETGKLAGFSFLAEGEHTWALTDADKYNPYPGVPSDRSLIADPDNFQFNRLQLAFDGLTVMWLQVGKKSLSMTTVLSAMSAGDRMTRPLTRH